MKYTIKVCFKENAYEEKGCFVTEKEEIYSTLAVFSGALNYWFASPCVESVAYNISQDEEDESIIMHAFMIATDAHDGAFRKGTEIPYIVHPVEAASIVEGLAHEVGGEIRQKMNILIASALLHDVVEDTDVTLENIEDWVGAEVATLVAAESEDKRPGMAAADTWKARKLETIDHVAGANMAVKILALGDKLANARAMARDYSRCGDAFFSKFNNVNKAEQGWYYKQMAESMKELNDTTAYREYVAIVHRVFD